MTEVALAILAKAPVPGAAKTRLIPALGAEGAARLQEWLIARTLATACAAACGPIRLAPITLWCTPATDDPAFLRAAQTHAIALATQVDGDLGARMLAACRHTPGRATLVIGTDCPALTVADLQQAARGLHDGDDAVLVPAEDGGYVLIGLRRADVRVFSGIDWGTAQVMAQTRRQLQAIGWQWSELASRWDVDLPADWRRLAQVHPELCGLLEPSAPVAATLATCSVVL